MTAEKSAVIFAVWKIGLSQHIPRNIWTTRHVRDKVKVSNCRIFQIDS